MPCRQSWPGVHVPGLHGGAAWLPGRPVPACRHLEPLLCRPRDGQPAAAAHRCTVYIWHRDTILMHFATQALLKFATSTTNIILSWREIGFWQLVFHIQFYELGKCWDLHCVLLRAMMSHCWWRLMFPCCSAHIQPGGPNTAQNCIAPEVGSKNRPAHSDRSLHWMQNLHGDF